MAIRLRRAAAAARTYKLCSLLLQYPDEALLAARADVLAAVAALPRGAAASALEEFGAWWSRQDAIELAQHYVETFDLQKRSGLYLTFYGQGDRRERGVALLRLKRMYRAAGLPLEGGELPDYLPVMLEFAAATSGRGGAMVLSEHRAALELLRAALRERGTPYADVLDAVCATVGEPSASDRSRMLKLASAGPPGDLVGLEALVPPMTAPTGVKT